MRQLVKSCHNKICLFIVIDLKICIIKKFYIVHINVQIIHETIPKKPSSWSLKHFVAFCSPAVIPEQLPNESYPTTV